jgi:quercetin dioxygenase-like cupin family protein
MTLIVEPFNRPDWTPLPYEGCREVEARGLVRLPHLSVAMLRFSPHGTIHEHAAEIEIDVLCLEGEGWTSVAGERAPLRAGQRVRWPAGQAHRLWTDGQPMLTLMLEHLAGPA